MFYVILKLTAGIWLLQATPSIFTSFVEYPPNTFEGTQASTAFALFVFFSIQCR